MKYSKVVIPIMGFTEHRGRNTGIKDVWRASRLLPYNRSHVWVMGPHTWDNDWKDVASFIEDECDDYAQIMIVAHSWGVGWGARKLAEHTKLRVQIVSADGVARSDLFPPGFNLNVRSLGTSIKIKLPANVIRVDAVYQHEGYFLDPQGHEFLPKGMQPNDPRVVYKWLQVACRHAKVDETPEFRHLADRRLRDFLCV